MRKFFFKIFKYAISGIMLLTSCSNTWNPFKPEEAPQVKQSSLSSDDPKSIINQLQTAYSERELNDYLNCLSEDFIFVLSQEDYAYFHLNENWWGKYTEEQIHRNLFQQANDVELKLTFLSSRKNSDINYELKYQYQLNVYISEIRYVADGYASYEVEKEDDQWKIIKWTDMLY